MKTILLIIFLMIIASPVYAEYKFAEDWHWQDTTLEGVFAAEVAVDLGQTLYQSEHPNQYEEVNPLLPKHPSKNQVWEDMVIGAGLHTLISLALPKHLYIKGVDIHPRLSWQSISITLEGANVVHNKSIGIGWSW